MLLTWIFFRLLRALLFFIIGRILNIHRVLHVILKCIGQIIGIAVDDNLCFHYRTDWDARYFIIDFLPIFKKILPVVKIWREVDCIEHLKGNFIQAQRSWLDVITFFYISMLVTWWLYQFSISVSNKPCNIESRPDEDLHDPRLYLICKVGNSIIYLPRIG